MAKMTRAFLNRLSRGFGGLRVASSVKGALSNESAPFAFCITDCAAAGLKNPLPPL